MLSKYAIYCSICWGCFKISEIDLTKVQALNEPDHDECNMHGNNYIHVHSCGISSQEHRYFSRPTGSPDYMLNMVAEGSLYYNCDDDKDGDTYLATKGSIVIFKPGEPQYLTNSSPDITRYWVHFLGYGAQHILEECHLDKERFYKVKYVKSLEELFLKTLSEIQSMSDYKAIKCNAYLLDLLSEIARLIDSGAHYDKQLNVRLAPVLKMINTQYRKDLNLDELANLCYMSKYHFIRAFKDCTGYTPYSYLTNVRINVAKDLLKNSSVKIGNISDAVGIPDQLYFSKLFKKHTGKSPNEYRREHI